MAKVTVVQVVYNSRRFIRPVFESIFAQTFKDLEVAVVISGNDDGSKEYLQQNFPAVKIIDPGFNIGFAKGHNLVFSVSNSEFLQLVNPDLILETNYIEEILKAFEDAKVGAATGKLLRYDFEKSQKTNIIDSTGVIINKSGRARDRGQHELDTHQYDQFTDIQAISGAGPMYRRATLENVKCQISNVKDKYEYFDEDFHSYWEDVDLSCRMVNAGWKCVYAPQAVGYHGRAAGSSPGGYKKVFAFIKFHQKLPPQVRELNYKNHIFMYIKNSKWFYPQFFVRELFMFIYVLIFETGTLKALPEMIRLLSKMWEKRKWIQEHITKYNGRKFL